MYRVLALACLLGLASPASPQSSLPAFEAFLDAVDKAQLQHQNGNAAAFKGLWSQRDDVTLAGGFGGPIAKGWPQISARLDAVGKQFSQGRHRATRISPKPRTCHSSKAPNPVCVAHGPAAGRDDAFAVRR
jgi:hypothetical protein